MFLLPMHKVCLFWGQAYCLLSVMLLMQLSSSNREKHEFVPHVRMQKNGFQKQILKKCLRCRCQAMVILGVRIKVLGVCGLSSLETHRCQHDPALACLPVAN